MTIFHMKRSILGCLRDNRVGTIDFLEDENGNPLSDEEARIELTKLLNKGHKVMPVGDDCEGFDVFGGGCPGHEPLAGSDLTRAMLGHGHDYIVCFVSDDSDEAAINSERARVVVSRGADYFDDSDDGMWNYAVPISNTGEPFTAQEVGL